MRRLAPASLAFLGLLIAAVSSANTWTDLTDMPGLGRHHPATFVVDGMGYVVTGSTGGASRSDDFFRYDPSKDEWTVLPDFPGSDRSYAYARAHDGKGYLGFGSGVGYFRDLWEYDPVTEQWTPLALCPGAGRQHPAFVITDNGKIFVGAGNTSSANLKDWWEYDIAGDSWVQRPDIPGPPRHHPYHFNIGDDAYVCFGHGAGIYRDVYRWSQADNRWYTMNLFPGEGRVAGTEFSYGGKGYVLSGEGVDHVQLDEGEFWEYDPSDDSWTRLTDHPGSGRWAPGSFVIGHMVYFLGGLSTVRLEKDLMQFALPLGTGIEVPALVDGPSIGIYPTPVQGVQLHLVDPEAVFEVGSARLFDASGREVARLEGDARSLQIPRRIASGQYFVTFGTKSGERVTKGITVLR